MLTSIIEGNCNDVYLGFSLGKIHRVSAEILETPERYDTTTHDIANQDNEISEIFLERNIKKYFNQGIARDPCSNKVKKINRSKVTKLTLDYSTRLNSTNHDNAVTSI